MRNGRVIPVRGRPTGTGGRRVVLALAVLSGLTLLGTLGFMWVEDLRFLDGLYMAVITLSTVGYQDVAPATALGRGFTIAFIIVGVGTALYAVVAVAEYLLEGRLVEALGRRSMDRRIQSLSGHVIVCGFGRLGRAVVEQLEQAGTPVVVVDLDASLESEFEAQELLYVTGSALEEGVLREAGIDRARALVAATPSDPDNVFIALSAREIQPEIKVHARADTEPGIRRMRLAGADQVISIHHLGGRRIANAIVRPAVVDFLELSSPGGGAPIDLEEVRLARGCAIQDAALRDLESHGVQVSVVAIRRHGEPTRLAPQPDYRLHPGDHVVVVGDSENVQKLAGLAAAPS